MRVYYLWPNLVIVANRMPSVSVWYIHVGMARRGRPDVATITRTGCIVKLFVVAVTLFFYIIFSTFQIFYPVVECIAYWLGLRI